jgi:hypothetical protein
MVPPLLPVLYPQSQGRPENERGTSDLYDLYDGHHGAPIEAMGAVVEEGSIHDLERHFAEFLAARPLRVGLMLTVPASSGKLAVLAHQLDRLMAPPAGGTTPG